MGFTKCYKRAQNPGDTALSKKFTGSRKQGGIQSHKLENIRRESTVQTLNNTRNMKSRHVGVHKVVKLEKFLEEACVKEIDWIN